MTENKWFFFIFWLMGGLSMASQAAHYFIGGESYRNSSLRNSLVVAQVVVGAAIAFYGWKKFQQLNKS